MKYFLHLFKWDVILLNRNQLFMIAAVITLLYIGIFYLLKPLGNLTTILIILIFNDPVITGLLFAGVLWMFDKNQNTLQAIAVLPVSPSFYLLSKAMVLSLLATLLSFIMTIAAMGLNFNGLHLFTSVFFSAFMFSCLGFCIGALARNFNQFLLYMIPVLLLNAVPFLSIFDIGESWYFLPLPSTGGIELLRSTFDNRSFGFNLGMYIHLIIWTLLIWLLANKISQSRLV